MKRAVLVLVVIGLGACGKPIDGPPPPSPPVSTTLTAPPTLTESVDVKPLLAEEPCALIGPDLLNRLDVPLDGESSVEDGAEYCRWEESSVGMGLVISVEGQRDPLAANFDRQGAREDEVSGFPAIVLAVEPDHVCEFWVKTAPEQGFWVLYGALNQSHDACAGARTVAEHLGDRVRGG